MERVSLSPSLALLSVARPSLPPSFPSSIRPLSPLRGASRAGAGEREGEAAHQLLRRREEQAGLEGTRCSHATAGACDGVAAAPTYPQLGSQRVGMHGGKE